MTAFLASVADLDEMDASLKAGVDILDLKNPTQGALGAWDRHDLVRAVRLIDGAKPISATIGDLSMEPQRLCAAVSETAATGVDFVKVGFFPSDIFPGDISPSNISPGNIFPGNIFPASNGGGDERACAEALGRCDRGAARLVAVLFADQAPDFSLLEVLAANGFSGVMLDTADKNGGGLRDYLEDNLLARFVAAAAARGLFSGLAGSLSLDDALPLLELGPDYLGFRGALCGAEGRRGNLDPHALGELVAVFRDWNASSPSRATATAGAQIDACSLS